VLFKAKLRGCMILFAEFVSVKERIKRPRIGSAGGFMLRWKPRHWRTNRTNHSAFTGGCSSGPRTTPFHLIRLRMVILDQLYNKLSRTPGLVTRRNALCVAIDRLIRAGVSGTLESWFVRRRLSCRRRWKPWLLPVMPRFVNKIQMSESKQIAQTIFFLSALGKHHWNGPNHLTSH
jgi:hypothetical protein